MAFRKLDFEIVEGETEGILYSGARKRRKTVLIRFGSRSFSKHALQLGLMLAGLEVVDGILTYIGLTLHGVQLEGNNFLSRLMNVFGLFPTLLLCKSVAILLIVVITCFAHKRRWIRPFIYMLCAIYITLAVVPWTYLLSDTNARQNSAGE